MRYHIFDVADSRSIGQKNLFLTGSPMEHENQKKDYRSWMDWINISIENAKELYKEVGMNLGEITRKVVSKIIEELRFFISKLTPISFNAFLNFSTSTTT